MPLKGLLLIIFSFTIFSSVKAQQNQFHFGAAAGKEGFITFPHLTYYRFTRSDSLQNSRFFYGAHAGFFIALPSSFSVGAVGGYKYKLLTMENAVSFWQETLAPGHTTPQRVYNHITLNPKIGLNYKSFWIKAGPSFVVRKNYDYPTG